MIQILIKRIYITLYSEMIYESKIACKYNLMVIAKQIKDFDNYHSRLYVLFRADKVRIPYF